MQAALSDFLAVSYSVLSMVDGRCMDESFRLSGFGSRQAPGLSFRPFSAVTSVLNTNTKLRAVENTLSSVSSVSDRELVAAVRAGDEGAFEQLFNRHRMRVTQLAGRFFNRREQVEEIVQESFSKAYFSLGDYEGKNEASFMAWITRITINTCYDELKKLRRHPETSIGELSEDEAEWIFSNFRTERRRRDAETDTIARDLASKLLSHLKPEDRLVVTLLHAEDLSASEIAKLMGWTIAKVKVRAHRARGAMRRILLKLK